MSVSDNVKTSVINLNVKIMSLYPDAEKTELIKDYEKYVSKWSLFKGSLNRHTNESAIPLVKSFYDEYMKFYDYITEKVSRDEAMEESRREIETERSKTRKDIPLLPEKKSGMGLMAVLIGIPVALLFFLKKK